MLSALLRPWAALMFTLLASAAPGRASAADWIYFDLGEVILTGAPATGYSFVPGALAALDDLHKAGYQIGMITNTPEVWGKTCSSKFAALRNFIKPRLKATEPPFPWQQFTSIIQPPFDRYRKPQPYVFVQGLAQACPGRALYIGETPVELAAAQALGYATWRKLPGTEWPTAAAVQELLDTKFNASYPANCDLKPRLSASLLAQDRPAGIDGCLNSPLGL